MTKPKDPYTTKAVQSFIDKMVVLRAARSIVNVSHIMDGMIKWQNNSKIQPIYSS